MKIFETSTAIVAFSDKSEGDLNFYSYSDEQREIIRQSISMKLGRRIPFPVYVNQVHKADIIQVSKASSFPAPSTEGDALITDLQKIPIGVFTADCCPVIIAGSRSVSATHAGWKSTLQGISSKTVLKHNEIYGAIPSELSAWIGPCIGPCCFELGDEVYEAFISANSDWKQFFTKLKKWHLDLRAINRYQLEQAGIPANQIIDYNECTLCNPEKYFSYRREHKKNGSLFSFVIKK